MVKVKLENNDKVVQKYGLFLVTLVSFAPQVRNEWTTRKTGVHRWVKNGKAFLFLGMKSLGISATFVVE